MTALARKASRFEPAIWFLLTFGLYVGYGAETFYKTDGPDLLWLFDVHRQHPWHVGYLPAFTVWHQILHLLHLDGSMFRVFTSFSALGMATGVAMFVAGLRRLCVDGVRRASAALLLAACPAAMLFGCVVELHAPLMAVVGLAFLDDRANKAADCARHDLPLSAHALRVSNAQLWPAAACLVAAVLSCAAPANTNARCRAVRVGGQRARRALLCCRACSLGSMACTPISPRP